MRRSIEIMVQRHPDLMGGERAQTKGPMDQCSLKPLKALIYYPPPPPPPPRRPTTMTMTAMTTAFVVYCIFPLVLIGLAGVWNDPSGSSLVRDIRSAFSRPQDKTTGAHPAVKSGKDNGDNAMHPRQRPADAEAKRSRRPTADDADKSSGVVHQIDEYISRLRADHAADPHDVFKTLNLAESLRQRDLSIHDGGSAQTEAIQLFEEAVELILAQRRTLMEKGLPTNVPVGNKRGNGGRSDSISLNDELFLDTNSKSTDGLLCATYCSLAKILFMANMFERAVLAYDAALELASGDYLDALVYRASTLIILGRYEEAAQNNVRALELDTTRLFADVYTGMSKILVAREEVVEGGWKTLVDIIEMDLPSREAQLTAVDSNDANSKSVMVDAVKRMHLAMFSYHDTKTKDAKKAWEHLSAAYRHKMSVLPPWNGQQESHRVAMVKQIFQPGFWPANVGSDSQVPIFVIGFVRSGSTLLERILDAHSQIVGTGEDSMFNGQLETIRNKIVQASMSRDPIIIQRTVQSLADKVVNDMRIRWESIENISATEAASPATSAPKRFVDKMLTNYMNGTSLVTSFLYVPLYFFFFPSFSPTVSPISPFNKHVDSGLYPHAISQCSNPSCCKRAHGLRVFGL